MEKFTICGVIGLNVTFGKLCEIWIKPLQHAHLLESHGCKPIVSKGFLQVALTQTMALFSIYIAMQNKW